uniref:VWFA domain-containing protein n=1 Tax=Setaria italica TaxID=4555 RepID=K3YD24_SETIT
MQGSSSSSSGRIDGKFKTVEAKAYAKVDVIHSGGIPVMVSITALSGTTEQRAPVDLVVVLHVREGCNVPKNWKDLLFEAMYTIVAKLDDRDRLAVIPSNRLTTWMSARRFVYPQLVTSKTSLTTALESAESILYGRKDEDKKIRTGCIIVISNSNDNIDSLVSWRLRSVHAFGFRDAQNARTMHKISSSRNCSYAILDDEHGQITQSFFATISRIITSAVAAMPVEIKLMCEQTVVLHSIGTPGVSYYISYDAKSAIMWPNAHLAGMTTNIIVYLGGVIHPRDLPQLFTVHVKYGNVLDKVHVQLVKEGSDESREVAAEIVRIEALEIIAGITTEDKHDWEQLPVAAHYLRERWTRLEDFKCSREARAAGLISRLADEMREMELRLYNNYYWLEYMLSWQSHQLCQLPLPQPFMHNQSNNDPLLQLRILAKAEGKITEHQEGIPVMVRVMASDAGLAMVERASVDLILVIDASYGVKEKEEKTRERVHLLIKAEEMEEEHNKAKNMAIKLVTDKLSVMDRLAIVPVQSYVTEPATGLFEMSKQGLIETSNKLRKLSMALTDNKAAQWREQKEKAMRIIRNCLHSAPSSSSSTRSPRSAKSESTASMPAHSTDVGGSTKMLHKALMYAMKVCWMRTTYPYCIDNKSIKVLDDRRGRKEDRLGSIIVISDNDDDSICMETLSPSYMVHAFGFYGTHSTRALYHIASSSNGIYNIINDDSNQITEAFRSCVNKMTSTISVDTKVEIMCNPSCNVALSTIESAQFRYSIGNDRKSCSVLVGALSAGTVKNFIIYVDNVREDDYDNLSKYITVRVKWMHAMNRMKELEGQVVVVRDGIDGYEEVVETITHLEAVKIASDITDPNHSKMAMADMLQQMCIKCPDFERSAGDERLRWLKSQMQKMEADQHMEITDPNDYINMVAEKLSYILSWLSYQRSYCWIKII